MSRTSMPRAVVLAVLASAISGCVKETQEGDATVFQWELWVPVGVIAACIVTTLFGLFLARFASRSSFIGRLVFRFSLMFTFLGIIVCAALVPILFRDKLTVSKQGFTYRTGLWWSPTVYDIPFAEVSRFEMMEKDERDQGREQSGEYLVCYRKGGGSESIPDHALIRRGGAAKILEIARQLGIKVEKEPTFAAIAYSPSTGVHGFSSNCKTLAEAESEAMAHCKEPDARVVTSAQGEWCALAVGEDKSFGFARGKTSAEAEHGAIEECKKFTKTPCKIAVSVFSGK